MMKRTFYICLSMLISLSALFCLAGCNIEGIFQNPSSLNVTSGDVTSSDSSSGTLTSDFSSPDSQSSVTSTSSAVAGSSKTSSATPASSTVQTKELRGIWISYYELNFTGKTEAQFKTMIDGMFDKIKTNRFNTVFCQIRPNSDAYYPSSYFPWAKEVAGTQGTNPGYDPLAYMVTAAHARGLSFQAWINPYRVSTKATDASSLSDNNPAKKWFTDGSRRVLAAAGGLYYNPANTDVQKLVLNGVKEILDKYKVDGIHFDDYFYPTTSESFDSTEYTAYKNAAGAGAMSLGDWRRTNVNILINSVYAKVHSYKNVSFGISPAAHISTDKTDKNYTEFYADIPYWISRTGYVDYIIPQLYFGYQHTNPDYHFDVLLQKWASLPRNRAVKMYVGLGAYKIGTTSSGDNTEWTDPKNTNLLARQAVDIGNKKLDGIVVYSYGSIMSDNDLNKKQRENLVNVLK